MNNWISEKTDLLPDFIIGGAMKSGTSTLHTILAKHPDIFIPDDEIHFFDIDDIMVHSDFNFFNKNNWLSQSMEKNPELLWEWYQDKFDGSKKPVLGEDSTNYLCSKLAAQRISIQKKEIKLVFILRQPSLRAYSNYIHFLRMGRSTHNFEDTIRFNPFDVLHRSLYKEQLELFYKYIPKERIKIVLFEDLKQNPEGITKEICSFINVDFDKLPNDVFSAHSNRSTAPKNHKLQTKKNLLFRDFGNLRYRNSLPVKGPALNESNTLFERGVHKFHSMINPLIPISTKINPKTKTFLDDYFYKELEGLNEIVEKDVMSIWFPEKMK